MSPKKYIVTIEHENETITVRINLNGEGATFSISIKGNIILAQKQTKDGIITFSI